MRTAAILLLVAAAASAQDKKADDKPKFNVYGFAQADIGHDFDRIDPRYFDRLRPSVLPNTPGKFGHNDVTFFSIRQSRIGLKTYAPSNIGEIFTIVEFDWIAGGADAGKTLPRMRHAYGAVRWLGAGQYWSPFIDVDSYPTNFESFGPTGLPWVRNIQVRWMPLRDATKVTIALEKPGASGEGGDFQREIDIQRVELRFRTPEWVASVRHDWKFGHVQLAGLYRRMWYDDLAPDSIDLSGFNAGYGGNLTGVYKFGKKNAVRLQYLDGRGIENYINDGTVDIAPKVHADPHRPIVGTALPVRSFTAYVEYYLGKWGAVAGGSAQDVDNTPAQLATAFAASSYGTGTLLYYPVANIIVAGEWQYGRRRNFKDGFAFRDQRLQLTLRYSFSADFHGQ